MRKNLIAAGIAACVVMGLGMAAVGDDYAIDPAHSGVTFQIRHSDISWIPGRFDKFSGEFAIDPSEPSRSSFKMSIDPDSVDTNNAQRDGHLKSPDFFDAKQYPTIEFASTSVKAVEGGYQVTGNLTMHGETKPVTFKLEGGKTAEMKGVRKIGFTTQFKVKRSEFGIAPKTPPGMLGDEVWVTISFQGARKK